jgi:hypothetical protein
MLLRTCLALLIAVGAWAQQARPAEPPAKQDDTLTRDSFSAQGLQHEEVLTDFFVGYFAGIPYDRGSAAFSALFQQYLEAYARHCGASLPVKNRVEMTRQVCADPPRLPGLPPPTPGTDSCSTWRTVSLGYADPALYAAKSELDKDRLTSHVTDALGLNAKNFKDFMESARDVVQLPSDMDALVRQNACDGGGLRRFQENVVLFSKGKEPIVLPGEPVRVTPNRGADFQPPLGRTRRPVIPPSQSPVDPALLAPGANSRPQAIAPSGSPDHSLQESTEERRRRTQKAVECRQQAVKDHPQGGVAMTQEYTSCLQAR